jgi:hypothetical protein
MGKSTVFTKRRRNTTKRKRMRKTKRVQGGGGGGLFDLFGTEQKGNSIVVDKTDDLSQKSSVSDNSSKKLEEASRLMSKVGKITITALAGSGVGIPIAALLAGIFLITNEIAKSQIFNYRLHTIILDVLNILNNSMRLFNFIFKSISIIKQENTAQRSIKIDENLICRLKEKLLILFKDILKIAPSKIVIDLYGNNTNELDKFINTKSNTETNTDINCDKFVDKELVKEIMDEIAKRSSRFDKLQSVGRVIDRNLSIEEKILNITTNLSIINGYFMIMKGDFDITCEYYRGLNEEEYKRIWQLITNTNEFKEYLEPDKNDDEVVAIQMLTPNGDSSI